MATANRVYVLFENGKAEALIRAPSQAQAIRHHTANRFEAIVADQDHLVRLLGEQFKVEDATAESNEAQLRG